MSIQKLYRVEIQIASNSENPDLVNNEAEKIEDDFYSFKEFSEEFNEKESYNVPACCGWSLQLTMTTESIKDAYKLENFIKNKVASEYRNLKIED